MREGTATPSLNGRLAGMRPALGGCATLAAVLVPPARRAHGDAATPSRAGTPPSRRLVCVEGGNALVSVRDAAPVDVAPYLNARAATTPAWLGGGKIAYLSDDSGVPQLWLTDTEGAPPRRLTDFGERIGEVVASPKGDRVVFGMDTGGDERHQLWLLDLAGGPPRPLTPAPGVIHRLGAISADGRRLSFASNARDERFFDVLTLDLDEPGAAPRPVLATDELLTPLAWSPDDSALLVRRDNTNLDADLLLVDAASGESTLLTPHDGEATLA